jgi:hypothetical protein
MATKDISDKQVLEAFMNRGETPVVEYLMKQTGECEKVVYAALNRADERGFLEYGVSIRQAWITEAGYNYLKFLNDE